MPTLVVKNVTDSLHERLKRRARENHRSMTQEAIVLLERGLAAPDNKPLRLPPVVKLKGGSLTLDDIESAIADSRD